MKKIFTIILIFGIFNFSFAQTQVSGNQSGTWTVENSPYQVIGEIIIPSGNTLTITQGVEVIFLGHYKFTVNGNLQAVGTDDNMILFTASNQSEGWGGIRLDNSSNINNLSYCRIEFGKTSGDYPDNVGGGLAIINSNAIVSNCIFADNDASGEEDGLGGAVYLINAGVSGVITSFTDCTFLRNHAYGEGGAIKFTNDINTEITNCKFIENNCLYGGGAISFYSVLYTKITNCLFVNNYTTYSNGGAINSLGIGNTIFFKNCTISRNSALGGEGGALSLAYAAADFVNCIIYDNPGLYGDDLYLSTFGTAEVNYSNLTMPWDATGANNIEVDPLFIDIDNLDFHLSESSPCIDAGIDIGLSYIGDAPDMGCFEFGATSSLYSNSYTDFKIFPNPTNGNIYFESNDKIKSIKVYNTLGQLVLDNKNLLTNINISQLQNGLYIIEIIKVNNNIIYKKIELVKAG